MRQAIRIFLFSIALTLLGSFAACTANQQSKPADAEGFAGNKQKYFYNHLSPTQILGIGVDLSTNQGSLFSITAAGISNLGIVPSSQIRITQDGTYLTLLGQNPIFEFNEALPATVAQPSFTLPATTIDTICFSANGQGNPLGSTGFSEARSYVTSGGYNLIGISAGGSKPIIASNPVFLRQDNGIQTTYLSSGIGLHINEQNPSANDPSYFVSTIDAAVSSLTDWSSATQMVCHLNLLPAPKLANPIVSAVAMTATDGGPRFPSMNGTWSSLDGALKSDGAMAVSNDVTDADTNFLFLKGYFPKSIYPLPSNATIDGVVLNCSWYADQDQTAVVYTSSVYLLKEGVTVGEDHSNDATAGNPGHSGLGVALPVSLSLSGNFGSPTTRWGVTLTPADINSANFGVAIGLSGAYIVGGDSYRGHIDYCRMSVYWH